MMMMIGLSDSDVAFGYSDHDDFDLKKMDGVQMKRKVVAAVAESAAVDSNDFEPFAADRSNDDDADAAVGNESFAVDFGY